MGGWTATLGRNESAFADGEGSTIGDVPLRSRIPHLCLDVVRTNEQVARWRERRRVPTLQHLVVVRGEAVVRLLPLQIVDVSDGRLDPLGHSFGCGGFLLVGRLEFHFQAAVSVEAAVAAFPRDVLLEHLDVDSPNGFRRKLRGPPGPLRHLLPSGSSPPRHLADGLTFRLGLVDVLQGSLQEELARVRRVIDERHPTARNSHNGSLCPMGGYSTRE